MLPGQRHCARSSLYELFGHLYDRAAVFRNLFVRQRLLRRSTRRVKHKQKIFLISPDFNLLK